MRAILLALLVAGPLACGHTSAPARGSAGGVTHTVQAGETVWRLSKRYGVPIRKILRANGLDDVTQVPTGARLFIPGGRDRGVASLPPPPAPRPSGARRHLEQGVAFAWPVTGELTSRFGRRGRGRHEGIDLSAPRGTPVRSAAAGRVIYSGSGLSDYGAGRVIYSGSGLSDYGNTVIVKHLGRYSTVYAHNRRNLVRKGEFVEAGQVLAEVGSTGNASGPHLHFEVRRDDRPHDPLRYLPPSIMVVKSP
jgi:murein DD-endopeptidase MepM/ murein hydrolase activator NlpD